MKEKDRNAYNWLTSKPTIYWSRSHFDTSFKCDMLLNNLCKSFNATLVEARQKPILSMLEDITIYLIKKMNARKTYMSKYERLLYSNTHKILEKNKVEATSYIPTWAGELKFEINCMHDDRYIVNLGNQTCKCGRWDLIGILCLHAFSTILDS